jgi:hypothetical protein
LVRKERQRDLYRDTATHALVTQDELRAKFDTKVLALDIEAGWTVEDAQAAGWPNDHPDRVEARWPAIQGTLGVNEDALPGEGRL